MPFYEYECAKCGYHDEVLQKISDKPLTKCPNCGKAGLRKLISAPVFRLKGSGWYETDFKSDKENKRNLAGAEKEAAKPESTPDAKPAADKAAADKPLADKAAAGKPAAKPVKTAARAKPKQKSARKRR
jgi:putative FmdB family regulatory protein